MKTSAVLSIFLAGVLGMQLEKVEMSVTGANQRPLVGDLLPDQGHVVVENPAPRPKLFSNEENRPSAPLHENEKQNKKENSQVAGKASVGKNLAVNNEVNPAPAKDQQPAPIKEVYSGPELQRQDMRIAQTYLWPEAEKADTEELLDKTEFLTHLEKLKEKHIDIQFDQPIMKLEPLTKEEMQSDELLDTGKTFYMKAEQSMFLEPEGRLVNEQMTPNVVDPLDQEGPHMRNNYIHTAENNKEWRSCAGVVLDEKCYQFFPSPKRAADAEENFPDGHLASITSTTIHHMMMHLMGQNGGTRRTWVGGLRFLDTGRFVWLDGSHWSYADWLWGEPNNTSGVEHCIELLSSGKFNDFTCWEPQAFICSYPYK